MITVGIIGLPNSGKSTLFNVLISEKKAKTAVTPFTTIVHHESLVSSEGGDFKFLDIAGLVRGSHRGQGMGNAFLEKIRVADILLHVVRAFYSSIVSHPHRIHEPGSLAQITEDIEVVKEELRVAGVHKPVIYVLNFDQHKMTSGVVKEYISQVEHKFGGSVMGVCAKLEEDLLGLTSDERDKRLQEANIDEVALTKVVKRATLLIPQKSLD